MIISPHHPVRSYSNPSNFTCPLLTRYIFSLCLQQNKKWRGRKKWGRGWERSYPLFFFYHMLISPALNKWHGFPPASPLPPLHWCPWGPRSMKSTGTLRTIFLPKVFGFLDNCRPMSIYICQMQAIFTQPMLAATVLSREM